MPIPNDPKCICGIDCESKCFTNQGALTCSVGMQGHSRHVVEIANHSTHDLKVDCDSVIHNTANISFDAPPAVNSGHWQEARTVRRAPRPTAPTIERFGDVPIRSFYGVTAHEEVETTVTIERDTGGGASHPVGKDVLIIKLKC